MTQSTTTRRRLIAAGSAASLAALSGCSSLFGSDDNGESAAGVLDVVPAGAAEVLVAVDVQRILNDDLFRERVETLAGSGPGDTAGVPTSVDDMLATASSALGLDPRDVSALLAFGELGEGTDDPSQGVVVDADWTERDLESALVSGGSFRTASHNGQPVYEDDPDAVGVLPDGRFVAGSPGVVRASIDTAVGDEPPLDNDAAVAFREAPDGYVRVGFAPSSARSCSASGSSVAPGSRMQRSTSTTTTPPVR